MPPHAADHAFTLSEETRDSPRARRWLRTVAVAALVIPSLSHAEPLATALQGVWQVEHVRNDRGATHKLAIQEDDPRLVGRFLDTTAGHIAFRTADGDATCGSPSLSPLSEGVGTLIAQTMAGRGAPPATPLPKDYGLALEPAAQVQALWLQCGSGAIGPGFGDRPNTWFMAMRDHRLAMGYYGSTVLILAPVTASAAPRASFDCGKAATPTEKVICGSRDLASFDESVAISYANNQTQFRTAGDRAATAKLEKSQKDWLRVRNRCGADDMCLRKAMAGRLQAMADPGSFTGE